MQLTERFNEALQFAAQLRAAQVRKVSGEPYVAHLLGVCSLVLDYGGGEDEAIAALLHDAIEDQGAHWQSQWHTTVDEEIGRRFGPAVLAIVRGCTDADTMPKPPWPGLYRLRPRFGWSWRPISCTTSARCCEITARRAT